MDRRTFINASGALAGLSLTPALLQQAIAQPVSKGGHLIVSLVPEPAVLLQSALNPAQVVALNISDGLATYDEDFKLVPQLAERWEKSDDGRIVTFYLRQGVKWHDGQPLTSADVQFSIENAKANNYLSRAAYSTLQKVEAPDAHTVVLTFEHPAVALWAVLDGSKTQILPAHIYQGDIAGSLKHANNNDPVGNGPFRFKEWVRGSHITLERNPDYWDQGKPLLEAVTFRFIGDAGARLVALETGEAHYAPLPAIPLSEARRIEQEKDGKLDILRTGWAAVAPIYYLDFNLEREFFQDVRVRRAIAHAIDRQLLANNAFFGFARPATGPIPSFQKQFYTPGTPQYDYDIDQAERLLDEAGLRKGPDGVRLKITNIAIPYGDDYLRSSQLIQQLLKRVGIEVEVRTFDVPTWVNTINVTRDWDTSSTFGATQTDPQVGAAFRRFWSKAGVSKGGNAAGYVSAEADRLIEAILQEGDVQRRVALLHDFQKFVQEEVPSVSLLELEFFRVASKSVKGLSNTPFGAFSSYANVHLEG